MKKFLWHLVILIMASYPSVETWRSKTSQHTHTHTHTHTAAV